MEKQQKLKPYMRNDPSEMDFEIPKSRDTNGAPEPFRMLQLVDFNMTESKVLNGEAFN